MEKQPAEKIIVFHSYDTVVQANLAKTKLDAYGIPCFLTEENLTSLYPLQAGIFSGVRLHIFERDAEEVKQILDHQPFDTFIKCPDCGSVKLEKEFSPIQKFTKSIFLSIGFSVPIAPSEYRCLNCGKKFEKI